MNQVDLKNALDALAWSPRGTKELALAASHPSPVVACVTAFNHLKDRTDRDEHETELLRAACQLIRTNHWFGLVGEAVEVETSLPPPPAPPAPHVMDITASEDEVIDLPINLSDQG